MDLLYISNGNIPSRWAHTVQVMKMSEAFTRLLPRRRLGRGGFRLLIESDYRRLFRRDTALRDWYGLRGPVSLQPLRRTWQLPEDSFEHVNSEEYNVAAITYAAAVRPPVIMTRSYAIAEGCVNNDLDVIFETHAGPGHAKLKTLRAIADAPTLRGVVTIAEPLRELYIEQGVDERQLLVWPDAVDLHRFEASEDRAVARAALGLSDAGTVVAYTGHLYDEKGIGTVLAAARGMKDVTLLVVGGWPRDIERWSAQFGDCDNIRFCGFVSNAEVPRYLSAADICVVPNSASDDAATYTSPMKLFEYMAARRAIIASDIPALRAALTDETHALLIAPDDPAAMEQAIRRLQQDSALREHLASEAFAQVRTMTWENRARDILKRFAPELLRA